MGFFDGIGQGIGNFVGNLLGNDMSRHAADHAADRSQEMAREQMAFQERMSNTAYQRATTDMKAAGINPMAAFMQGGASTPSGASGSAPMAQTKGYDAAFQSAVSSAMDYKRLKNETEKVQQDIRTGKSTASLNDALSTKALMQAQESATNTRSVKQNMDVVSSQMKAIKAKAAYEEKRSQMDLKAAPYDAIMNRLSRDAGTASKIFKFWETKTPNKGDLDPNKDIIINSEGVQTWPQQ